MMDLPPPPVQPCIVLETAQPGSIFMLFQFEGSADAVTKLLTFIRDYPVWKLDPEEPQQDARLLRLRAPADTPYRQIDPLLDAAQRLGLTVTMKTEPPICGMENL